VIVSKQGYSKHMIVAVLNVLQFAVYC